MDIPVSLKPHNLAFPPKLQPLGKGHQNKDWNAVIKNHAKLKNDNAILSTYSHMESLGVSPDAATLPLVFKACGRLNAVERGKRVHFAIEGTELVRDVRVGTAIVDFYCKFGLLGEADKVFDEMTERDLVAWNAMISGYAGCGCYQEAIGLFRKMGEEGVGPNSRTLVALLLASGGILDLRFGKEIHGNCLRIGYFDACPHVSTALIGFYLNFDVEISRLVFDLLDGRSTVSWNAMITGYSDAVEPVKALQLFVSMLEFGVKLDSVTLLVVIQACAEVGAIKLAMQIHQLAIKFGCSNDLFVVNALLNMYSHVGSLESACKVFDVISIHDLALWNCMITAYIDHGCYDEAIHLFTRMRTEVKEDERTIVVLLGMCIESADGLRNGKGLHAHAIKCRMMMGIPLGNALLSMYSNLNCTEDAGKIFSEMSDLDVISYNTMISALARSNLWGRALELFGLMREGEINPNSHTIISFLAACRDETCLPIGQCIHGVVIKSNIELSLSLNTALMEMYMQCGHESTARNLFQACPDRDLISWNAMIAGYIKSNQAIEALLLLNHMISESEVEPNSVIVINILSMCTDLANLPQGECLHGYATRRFSPFSDDLGLANAFITMYTRCGSLQRAEKIFKTLRKRNIISWNAMITGYSTHGHSYDAILAFRQMIDDGFEPNGITFLSVLSACRHAGLIKKGLQLFHSMVLYFNITPVLAHYGCVVDLLGRGGYLNEARKFIESMPIEPDASVWRSLLSACRDYSDTTLAGPVFENLVKLEPTNAGNYVLASNIYAAAGLWPEVRKVRTRLKEMGLRKPLGMSWITIRGQTHSFAAADTSHRHSAKIYASLSSLLVIIRKSGYVADVSLVPEDEED